MFRGGFGNLPGSAAFQSRAPPWLRRRRPSPADRLRQWSPCPVRGWNGEPQQLRRLDHATTATASSSRAFSAAATAHAGGQGTGALVTPTPGTRTPAPPPPPAPTASGTVVVTDR